MKNILGKRRARLGAIALATAGLVVLAGCSSSGGDGDAGGSAGEGPLHAGLPWGSSAEEFAAAVADMEPVNLTVQSSAPSGGIRARVVDDPVQEPHRGVLGWQDHGRNRLRERHLDADRQR